MLHVPPGCASRTSSQRPGSSSTAVDSRKEEVTGQPAPTAAIPHPRQGGQLQPVAVAQGHRLKRSASVARCWTSGVAARPVRSDTVEGAEVEAAVRCRGGQAVAGLEPNFRGERSEHCMSGVHLPAADGSPAARRRAIGRCLPCTGDPWVPRARLRPRPRLCGARCRHSGGGAPVRTAAPGRGQRRRSSGHRAVDRRAR